MPKDTFYFSHDYNARTDPKVKKLLSRHGIAGYGIYWALIEDLYNNSNKVPSDYETIAYDLKTDTKVISSIIEDFGLFTSSDGFFSSDSVKRRLEERNGRSEKARQSAEKRWNRNANALQSDCEPNAIKERKGKERKEKENRGVKFSEDGGSVIFEDGDQQPLGEVQKLELGRGSLVPRLIEKGVIH